MYVSTLSPILTGIRLVTDTVVTPNRQVYASLMKTTGTTPIVGTYSMYSGNRIETFQDGRLYVPKGASLVRVYAYAELGSNPDAEGQRFFGIYKNGVAVKGSGFNNQRVNNLGNPFRYHISAFTGPIEVVDGDYFSLYISGDQMTYFLSGLTNMELEVLA